MNTKSNSVRAFSAGVKYSNTPESDRQQTVWHTVKLTDGREIDILAEHPGDAIDRVNKRIALGILV